MVEHRHVESTLSLYEEIFEMRKASSAGCWHCELIKEANVIMMDVSATILDTSATGIGCAIGGKAVCRRNRKTRQVVDVVPKTPLYEPESIFLIHIFTFLLFSLGFLRPYHLLLFSIG